MRIIKIIFLLFVLSFSLSCNKEDNSSETSEIKDNEVHKTDSENEIVNESSGDKSGLQTITSAEVKLHIGDSLSIKGFVADIYLTDKVAYLNFENKFPKNVFSCAIFENKFSLFGDLSKYKNRAVEVTGKITTYKNKPQVILISKDQIKILKN